MAEHDLHRVAFPTLDDVQVATLAKFGTRRALRDGELLFQAGARDYKFFVVERGAVEIVEHSSGEPKTVTLHKVHAFGGDVSLVTGRPALISAVARGDTEVFEIAPSDIRRIMGERPALGELLLRAFIARRELLVASDFQGLRVLGAGSSRDTFRIRDFLARNQVPFTWIDVDHDPQVGELLRRFGLSEADTPVVVFGSEPLLRNPSTRALADLIGVRRPLTQRVYDLVIVGGGPAGLAAAVYASSEGLATAVIDATAPGGQAGTSSKIENYLGFPTGISGTDLANRAILQAQKFGAQFSSPSQVARLDFENDKPVVWFDDGEHVSTRCVLIATGANYRKLDVPRREQFEGLGVYYAAPRRKRNCAAARRSLWSAGATPPGKPSCFFQTTRRRGSCSSVTATCVRVCPAIWWTASRELATSRCCPTRRFPTC